MITISAVVFVLIVAIVFGAYWFFVERPDAASDRKLRRRVHGTGRPTVAASVMKAPEQVSAVGPLASALARNRALVQALQRLIAASGVGVSPGAVVLASIFCAALAGAAVLALAGRLWPALIFAPAAACLPFLFLRRRARKRLHMFEEQFPEAIDLLARALRAGHALNSGLQMAADEMPDPVGGEFRQLFEHQNYGMSLADALRAFAVRVPLLDARFFATAVLTQRETGGNLSEILDNLAKVIRERFQVRRQVRALSAHGRITGVVLEVLPIAVAALLFLIAPAHLKLLIQDPIGIDMVIVGIMLQMIGMVAIRRIVNVEY
jgi:tight adherence protein B